MMDLLEQYKTQHPEAFRPARMAAMRDSGEYGFIIKFVIRMPGGVVRDARSAKRVLLGASGVLLALALVVFFAGSGSSRPQIDEDNFTLTPPSGGTASGQ